MISIFIQALNIQYTLLHGPILHNDICPDTCRYSHKKAVYYTEAVLHNDICIAKLLRGNIII